MRFRSSERGKTATTSMDSAPPRGEGRRQSSGLRSSVWGMTATAQYRRGTQWLRSPERRMSATATVAQKFGVSNFR